MAKCRGFKRRRTLGRIKRKILEEIADILIFTIEFANMANIDIASAIDPKNGEKCFKIPRREGKSVFKEVY